MLARSDVAIPAALEALARHGIDAALLVPTANGLAKSIMDATEGLRDYLLDNGYHDFDQQGQGSDHKVAHTVFFVGPSSLVRSTASLYRPATKSGDPRIWLGAATRENARPFNLLALTVQGGDLYVVNMSDARVRQSLDDPSSPFRKVVDANRAISPAANELIGLLREISSRGFIQTLRAGDTGVGMTLETLLGIAANSKKAPDYRGIELKAKRRRAGNSINRSTLFSKVPSWKLSPVGSALGLLAKRGYSDPSGRRALYHTLRGTGPNSLGLALQIDGENDWLKQVHVDSETGRVEHDVTWQLDSLRSDLAAKHRETFWVHAACREKGPAEQFHYVEVQHTRAPLVRNFSTLVEAGVITVDYAMHLQGKRVRDHGYLFKIHPNDMGALFQPPEIHALA